MLFKIQMEFDIEKEEKLKCITEISNKMKEIFDKNIVDKLIDFSIEFIELNGD